MGDLVTILAVSLLMMIVAVGGVIVGYLWGITDAG